MYLNDITSSNPAPYNVNNFGATDSPDQGFGLIQDIAVSPGAVWELSLVKQWGLR